MLIRCSYVHRLVQNQEDGQLVELPRPGPEVEEWAEKDGLASEDGTVVPAARTSPENPSTGLSAAVKETDPEYFSSLLVAQLESQRLYYEERLETLQMTLFERLERLSREHVQETSRLREALERSQVQVDHLQTEGVRERQALLADTERLGRENVRLRAEVASERAMSEQAAATTSRYVALAREREEENVSLQEQLQDLMAHIESQEQVRSSDQGLSGGTIVLGRTPSRRQQRHQRRGTSK